MLKWNMSYSENDTSSDQTSLESFGWTSAVAYRSNTLIFIVVELAKDDAFFNDPDTGQHRFLCGENQVSGELDDRLS